MRTRRSLTRPGVTAPVTGIGQAPRSGGHSGSCRGWFTCALTSCAPGGLPGCGWSRSADPMSAGVILRRQTRVVPASAGRADGCRRTIGRGGDRTTLGRNRWHGRHRRSPRLVAEDLPAGPLLHPSELPVVDRDVLDDLWHELCAQRRSGIESAHAAEQLLHDRATVSVGTSSGGCRSHSRTGHRRGRTAAGRSDAPRAGRGGTDVVRGTARGARRAGELRTSTGGRVRRARGRRRRFLCRVSRVRRAGTSGDRQGGRATSEPARRRGSSRLRASRASAKRMIVRSRGSPRTSHSSIGSDCSAQPRLNPRRSHSS